ncbi:DNA topoisomerase IB [Streptomyces kunmingensis]|uniref:DNA topoisomerase n=1 Tax=Streptomyces kunmingensis TaxID=68225 RepID=A0ABU6CI69_9ACTN|nr:DNA topoisomerase IB [Streptomyces kunmingensis]MEB3964409.1 DNA topoisomerase IB [Streptomyces kunmingensis]
MREKPRLRTSHIERPGITRVRSGRGFRYVDASGRPITDSGEKERLRELVIPPAWQDVWICPWPNGHLQAVGTDAAGRRQYLYHPQFRERQELAKHDHVLEVARALPDVRAQVTQDLDRRGLCRERVLACAVRLLDLGFFRIGNESYRRDNGTYGLTTLLKEHASCQTGEVCLTYPAKYSKTQSRAFVDPPACKVLRALLRRSGDSQRLFAYWQGGSWHELDAAELNDYLRDSAGKDITAKDFRTWHATVLAAVALAVSARVAKESRTARKSAVTRAVREVSEYLGNTPAVCRASYINPRIIELFDQGRTIAGALDQLGDGAMFGHPATQGPIEEAVLRLLA